MPARIVFVTLVKPALIPVMQKTAFVLLLLLNVTFLSAQQSDTASWPYRRAEMELKALQQKVFFSKKEDQRFEGNREFMDIWEQIVHKPGILNYAFTELKEISVLSPADGKFKLITWNIPKDDGTHFYFGYLLVNNNKRVKKGFLKHETVKGYEVFKLLDRSATVKSPESYVGTADKWFGMLYYQLVECEDYYMLLGYDLNDKLTQKKFVDVLYFKSDGTPVFGKDVFRFPRKNPRRLMFEYSKEVSMSLKYQEKENRIVYSHLSANKEGELLEGQHQFYGPDGTFDALEQKKGKWVTVEDVDARNEKSKKDNTWNNPKRPTHKKNEKIMPKQQK